MFNSEALDALGLQRYCCRRMVLTHVDLIEKLLHYNRKSLLQVLVVYPKSIDSYFYQHTNEPRRAVLEHPIISPPFTSCNRKNEKTYCKHPFISTHHVHKPWKKDTVVAINALLHNVKRVMVQSVQGALLMGWSFLFKMRCAFGILGCGYMRICLLKQYSNGTFNKALHFEKVTMCI